MLNSKLFPKMDRQSAQCLPLTVEDASVRRQVDQAIWHGDIVRVTLFFVQDIQVRDPELTKYVVHQWKRLARADVGESFISPALAQEHIETEILNNKKMLV